MQVAGGHGIELEYSDTPHMHTWHVILKDMMRKLLPNELRAMSRHDRCCCDVTIENIFNAIRSRQVQNTAFNKLTV